MKKILYAAVAVLALAACKSQKKDEGAKVMARFVPERYDDFIFENDLVAGRLYGEALESCGQGQITSPGIDVWVKTPGGLVCDQRYTDELQNGKSYHINWGNGKDCYKVGRSLGAGASAVVVAGAVVLPATNFRSYEVLEQTPDKVVFVLNYPEWDYNGTSISLSKKLTVTPGTYFVKVEDTYTFSCESMMVAAGVNRHADQGILEQEVFGQDRYAIWESASDQSVEKDPETRVGVAVVVPGATFSTLSADETHALVGREVKSGETFTYCFGSCWNGGMVKTAQEWFAIVNNQ